jgi:hypothetical protein
MDRCEILAAAASGIDSMINALRHAKVLTDAEHDLIWNVVWGVVVDAKKERKAQELAKETAEIL